MRKWISALLLVIAITISASVVVARTPGVVLWKQECPPWATLRVNETETGWKGVECFAFDEAARDD